MTKMTERCLNGLPYSSGRSIWLLVGQRIRARRVECGHPVRQLAEELGVSLASYTSYESGRMQMPALLLTRLSEVLGVPVIWFFQDAPPSGECDSLVDRDAAPTYRVATLEQRVGALADSFRKLDLEGQQQLLAIAIALSQAGGNRREK